MAKRCWSGGMRVRTLPAMGHSRSTNSEYPLTRLEALFRKYDLRESLQAPLTMSPGDPRKGDPSGEYILYRFVDCRRRDGESLWIVRELRLIRADSSRPEAIWSAMKLPNWEIDHLSMGRFDLSAWAFCQRRK